MDRFGHYMTAGFIVLIGGLCLFAAAWLFVNLL